MRGKDFEKGLRDIPAAKPKSDRAGRRPEYKTLTLEQMQERDREKAAKRAMRERERKAQGITPKPLTADAPKPHLEAHPEPWQIVAKMRPLSPEAKASAIAAIAQRAAEAAEAERIKAEAKAAEKAAAELARAEARKEAERRRRAEISADPIAAEALRASKRRYDRERRIREGAKPRPNAQLEATGAANRPKV